MKKKTAAVALAALIGLGAAAVPILPRNTATHAESAKTITVQTLKNKIEGGWLGALWGNFTGLPTEFKFIDRPGTYDDLEWAVSQSYVTDDDTSFEYTFLHMMEVYGVDDITYRDMPAEWIYHFQDYLWEGNYNAMMLMKQGVVPPETGKKGVNKAAEAIDAQIECEIFGMITPGMLENCYGRTKWWMAAVGDGVVLENSAFYAMLCADAFFSDDIYESLRRVRSYFGAGTETAQMYDFVKLLHDADPDDWHSARSAVHARYYNGYVLDCRINFAATLLALFYGNNEYKKTVEIGVLAGYDNDCNAATAGTIMGIMCGMDGLPTELLEKSGTYYRNTNRPGLNSSTLSQIAERIAAQAEQVILNAGGVKNGGEFTVYDVAFSPSDYGVTYTKSVNVTDDGWSFNGMNKFSDSKYKGGTGYGTTVKGGHAEFKFTGTEVSIVGTTSVNGGRFALTLDGKDCGIIDLGAEETVTVGKWIPVSYGQTLRKLRGLENTEHTLRLTALDDGKWHSVDYAEIECTEDEYYDAEGINYARTAAATPICSVPAPLGTGAGGGGIGVICDGMYFTGHSSTQYDSFLGFKNDGTLYPKDYEDYVGYSFDRPLTLSKLVFQEGGHWGDDGGWFANGDLRVQVYFDGQWRDIAFDISPSYPIGNSNAALGAQGSFYTFTFEPIQADGVRIIGAPGGRQKLISCGELEVYGGKA